MEHNSVALSFGGLLRQLRMERKLTQERLAEAAGIERNYIYYLEKGRSDPSLKVLLGLATGLDMSFQEFAGRIERTLHSRPKWLE